MKSSQTHSTLPTTIRNQRGMPLTVNIVAPPAKKLNDDKNDKKASANTIAIPSMEESSKRFARELFLAYDDYITDGFYFETSDGKIALDAKDEELKTIIASAKRLLSFMPNNRRANTLVSLIKTKFQTAAITSHTMIRKALLLKYLADSTVINPSEWRKKNEISEPVQCLLRINRLTFEVTITVLINGQSIAQDLTGVKKESTELQSPSGKIKHPNDSWIGQIAYNELSNYHGLRPGMGQATLNGRPVQVMTSLVGKKHALSLFITHMHELGITRHRCLAPAIAMAYSEVSPDAKTEVKSESMFLGQPEGFPVPQLVGVFECWSDKDSYPLAQIIKASSTQISTSTKITVFLQIAQALNYLHWFSIPYGQLNSTNIRVNRYEESIQLAPPDLSLLFGIPNKTPPNLRPAEVKELAQAEMSMKTRAAYWAPERFSNFEKITFQTDIYAFGCIMYAVLMQAEPFAGQSFDAIQTAVLAGTRPVINRERTGALPTELIRLVSDCMEAKPEKRPTLEACIERLRSCEDLEKLIKITEAAQWNPNPSPSPPPAAPVAGPTSTCGGAAAATATPAGARAYAAQMAAARDVKGGPAPSVAAAASRPIPTEPDLEVKTKPKRPAPQWLGPREDYKTLQLYKSKIIAPPLTPQFADGVRTIEDFDAARMRALEKLGVIDHQKMLVSAQVTACQMYIIHRNTGNVALVTRGLADPIRGFHAKRAEIELLAEAREAEVGTTNATLSESYLFRMLDEVEKKCHKLDWKLRQIIDVHGFMCMELNNVYVPEPNRASPVFTNMIDPKNPRNYALLGVYAPDVPDFLPIPGKPSIRLVTVRLLTLAEYSFIQHTGNAGLKALAEMLVTAKYYHVSSTRPARIPRLNREVARQQLPSLAKAAEERIKARRCLMVLETKKIAPKPIENINWDTPTVRKKFAALQKKAQAVAQMTLPFSHKVPILVLDEKSKKPIFTPWGPDEKVVFSAFAKSTPLASAMSRFTTRLDEIIASSHNPLAKRISEVLTMQTRIANYKHFQDYIANPKEYGTDLKNENKRDLDILQNEGEQLVRQMLETLMWFVDLEAQAEEEFDPDFFLNHLAQDSKWIDEAGKFSADTEAKINLLMRPTQSLHRYRLAAFIDSQYRAGISWPHSPKVLEDIKIAGFVHKPALEKRDRCVCEQCGVEVSSWRKWDNPWQKHDLSKHTIEFQELASRMGDDFPQTGLYTFITRPHIPTTEEQKTFANLLQQAAQPQVIPTTQQPIVPSQTSANPFAYLALMPALGDNAIWNSNNLWEKLGPSPFIDEKVEQKLASVFFEEFTKPPTAFSNAMCRFDMRLWQIQASNDRSNLAFWNAADHVLNVTQTQTQLAGWMHFANYIHDTDRYIVQMTRRGKIPAEREEAINFFDESSPLSILRKEGERLIQQMLQHVKWAQEFQTRKNEEFNPDLALRLLAMDKNWMRETSRYREDAKAKVAKLVQENLQKFTLFRDMQRLNRVAWPHTTQMRSDMEAAGFAFSPMMIKRDRCVCDTCGVEVVGWRPWHNPWQMHDLTRHDAEFSKRVNQSSGEFSQTGLYPKPHSSLPVFRDP